MCASASVSGVGVGGVPRVRVQGGGLPLHPPGEGWAAPVGSAAPPSARSAAEFRPPREEGNGPALRALVGRWGHVRPGLAGVSASVCALPLRSARRACVPARVHT